MPRVRIWYCTEDTDCGTNTRLYGGPSKLYAELADEFDIILSKHDEMTVQNDFGGDVQKA